MKNDISFNVAWNSVYYVYDEFYISRLSQII